MDIRTLSVLERTASWVEELIEACQRLKPLYTANPKLAAEVSRKSKALRTALQNFQAFLNDPEKPKAEPEQKKGKKSLRLRLAFQAPYRELAKLVGRQGITDPEFWDHYRTLCDRFGQARMSEAVDAIIWFERHPHDGPATARLTPEALNAAGGLLGTPSTE